MNVSFFLFTLYILFFPFFLYCNVVNISQDLANAEEKANQSKGIQQPTTNVKKSSSGRPSAGITRTTKYPTKLNHSYVTSLKCDKQEKPVSKRANTDYTLSRLKNDRDVSAYSGGRRSSSRAPLVCFLTRSKRNTGIDA